MNMRAKVNGFTIGELLAVIIVLGILAAISTPRYFKTLEGIRATEATHYLGALRSAELRYRAESATSSFTPSLADLDVEFASSLPNWGAPALTVVGGTGMAQFTRTTGTYQGQVLGIRFGSGTLCGTFEPLQPLPACAAD